MAETIFEYDVVVHGPDHRDYVARACGRERAGGTWEGWIEFEQIGGPTIWRTARETTQPNRTHLLYWATGVSAVYLEGALARAIGPRPVAHERIPSAPAFDGPAPDFERIVTTGAPATSLLDPFSVYAKGETLLVHQLNALAPWHLRNIARAYRISEDAAALPALTKAKLVDLIVTTVRASHAGSTVS